MIVSNFLVLTLLASLALLNDLLIFSSNLLQLPLQQLYANGISFVRNSFSCMPTLDSMNFLEFQLYLGMVIDSY